MKQSAYTEIQTFCGKGLDKTFFSMYHEYVIRLTETWN